MHDAKESKLRVWTTNMPSATWDPIPGAVFYEIAVIDLLSRTVVGPIKVATNSANFVTLPQNKEAKFVSGTYCLILQGMDSSGSFIGAEPHFEFFEYECVDPPDREVQAKAGEILVTQRLAELLQKQLAIEPEVLPLQNNGHGVNGNGDRLPWWQAGRQSIRALAEKVKLKLWRQQNSHNEQTPETPTTKENSMKKTPTKKKTASKKTNAKDSAAPKSEAPSAETLAAAPTPVVSDEPVAEGFDFFTEEAWAWMTDVNAIPGACGTPMSYIGGVNAEKFAEAVGRPITLDEAKRLVQADGPESECSIRKGFRFQPVAYAAFCPGGLKKQIEAGETLITARLRFGGQFYFNKEGGFSPVSGTVYTFVEENNSYPYAWASHLYNVALMAKKATGHFQWGIPWGEVEAVLERKKDRQEMRERTREFVESLVFNAPTWVNDRKSRRDNPKSAPKTRKGNQRRVRDEE